MITERDLASYIESYLHYYNTYSYNIQRNAELSRVMLEKIYAKMQDSQEYGFLLLVFEAVANALKN